MIATQDIDRIIGSEAVDPQNDKIGKVSQVYIDQDTEQPRWVSVRTGLFGTSESLIPLDNANWDSDTLHVGYDKARVKDAPRIDADRELSPEEQEKLYSYYGLNDATGGFGGSGTTGGAGYADTTDTTTTGTGMSGDTGYSGTTTGRAGVGTEGAVGRDTSGPTTDDAMTRSEERLNVGTETVQTGRARLRKHVVTEQQNVTVPVTREEVRIEREPITDANRDAAYDGPDLSGEEHEVVLTEERPVVKKETVPVERVRLSKDQVTEQQNVSEDVRREEIDMDGDGTTGRTA
ncbi:PRC and DUF2382 domain-containing protein [Amnibacterium sp.]|jgi:uncharacterized protein (TIGR02271 family)|uniref:PRC and DUF2382 domain-containing protein n=1 Tax=Amnibacterium sp. TaxID=1872496 RepID=UPI00262683E2|nr:PRC and DUF2382 domain-containing protein [Amnibacterium sp.]MCU1472286.1 uncharacterized protein [Amnibacterium sp.]